MRIPTALRRELEDIKQCWDAALANPEVAARIDRLKSDVQRAHELQGPARAEHVSAVLDSLPSLVDLMIDAEPRLTEVQGKESIVAVLKGDLVPEAVSAPIRIRGPVVQGTQVVHVLRDPAAIQEFAATVRPGRILVDATDLEEGQWRELWAFVGEQQRLEGLRARARPGRPPGSRSATRRDLIDRVRSHLDWSNTDVYRAGVELGVWEPGSYSEEPRRNWARVRRIREAARRR